LAAAFSSALPSQAHVSTDYVQCAKFRNGIAPMSREMAGPFALSYRSASSMTRGHPIDLVIRAAVGKILIVVER